MKKAILFILFFCASLQMNAQQVYNEEGKYYELGYVDYLVAFDSPGYAFFYAPSITPQQEQYKNENGLNVLFKNFMACVQYFMSKGWSVFDIDYPHNLFMIRREITKEQAEKLASECIKDLKPSKK